jgi:hypothetical protein
MDTYAIAKLVKTAQKHGFTPERIATSEHARNALARKAHVLIGTDDWSENVWTETLRRLVAIQAASSVML